MQAGKKKDLETLAEFVKWRTRIHRDKKEERINPSTATKKQTYG